MAPRKGLARNQHEVLDTALAALQPFEDWRAEMIQTALEQALAEDPGSKSRLSLDRSAQLSPVGGAPRPLTPYLAHFLPRLQPKPGPAI